MPQASTSDNGQHLLHCTLGCRHVLFENCKICTHRTTFTLTSPHTTHPTNQECYWPPSAASTLVIGQLFRPATPDKRVWRARRCVWRSDCGVRLSAETDQPQIRLAGVDAGRLALLMPQATYYTYLADTTSVPLAWCVPLRLHNRRGKFKRLA